MRTEEENCFIAITGGMIEPPILHEAWLQIECSSHLMFVDHPNDLQPQDLESPQCFGILFFTRDPLSDLNEAVARLREVDSWGTMPIIMVADRIHAGTAEVVYASGANACIELPTGKDELKEMLEDLVRFWGKFNLKPRDTKKATWRTED